MIADLIYKAIAFIVLTPLTTFLFRILVAAFDRSLITDIEIFYFFLGPAGWVTVIAVGAVWAAIHALEVATLLSILAARDRIVPWSALLFAGTTTWRVSRLAARIIAMMLAIVAPFLLIAAASYFTLLTEFDINYYLSARPAQFWIALALGGVLAVALACATLWVVTAWFFALPILIFEKTNTRTAMRLSSQRSSGHRWKLVIWIVGWSLSSLLLSSITTALSIAAARTLIPMAATSMTGSLFAIGAMLMLWGLLQLAVHCVSIVAFAALYFRLYRELGRTGDSLLPIAENLSPARSKIAWKLSLRRVIALLAIAVPAALFVGAVTVRSLRLDDQVEIIAHRGSSSSAPENTLAAFRQAIEDKADYIELDVQETADGEVVVFHDSDFMKLAKIDLKIWHATMPDLKRIDIGSWFAPQFRGEHVPTLREALELCKGRIRVNIELKYYGHDQELERKVLRIVEECGMKNRVVFMSLKLAGIRKLKSLNPDSKVGLLLSVSAGKLAAADVDFLAMNASFADRKFIRDAHSRGQKVYVWTVNEPVTMSRLISRGVDGIITDRPELARRILLQRNALSPPERLVLEALDLFGIPPTVEVQ